MKKVLFLDDHAFWSDEIIEYLRDDKGLEVHYAQSYNDACKLVEKEKHFDMSILDVILQNGKTGILFAETFKKDKLGNIIFITGCNDQTTTAALGKYQHAHKMDNIWETLDNFINQSTSR